MNTTTTLASHVTNATPFTTPDDPGGNHTVEAYTVVLSVTAHLTSMMFGGGSSAAVITAVMTKGNINKYSYLLVLTLFFACCSINFVWSPMEISDILVHHFHLRHPTNHFVAAKTAVYIFLVALININIVLLSLEGVIRIANCFGGILQRIWPLTASLFALAWSAILTAIFVSKIVENSDSSASNFYVLTEYDARVTYLTLIIFIFSMSCLLLFVLIIQFLKIHIYWESGRPHFRKKKMNLALPEFLISQSNNACDDDTGGYDNVNEPSTSRSPSPSTPKLLMVSSPDTASIKGDEATPIPNATPKTSGNRLGINMGQILGRRRHTICQISDSTNLSTAPADPLVKAKQYNYVRKFSVDVSALQAQLQNPKIFKEAPFQSDIDLTKKGDDTKSRTQKPLQPLQPLNLKLNETKGPSKPVNDIKVETPPSAGLSIPPPVIMVSNDDVIPENNDAVADEKENVENKPTDNTPTATTVIDDDESKDNCNHQISRPEKPTSLPLKENRIDDVASVPTLESAVTDPSDTELESSKLARLAVYMGITFLLTMIPVLVTEALWHSMSTHAFVNISTCTLAISTIQTIIYPHLIACSDDVVHRAVQRLNDRVKRIFCRGEFGHQPHNVDETSSTSQV